MAEYQRHVLLRAVMLLSNLQKSHPIEKKNPWPSSQVRRWHSVSLFRAQLGASDLPPSTQRNPTSSLARGQATRAVRTEDRRPFRHHTATCLDRPAGRTRTRISQQRMVRFFRGADSCQCAGTRGREHSMFPSFHRGPGPVKAPVCEHPGDPQACSRALASIFPARQPLRQPSSPPRSHPAPSRRCGYPSRPASEPHTTACGESFCIFQKRRLPLRGSSTQ